jgi:glycerol-3-phosphate acyltransferase PlsY
MRTECNNLHIHKFPAFAVFKKGGGYEMHHGTVIFIACLSYLFVMDFFV